jgi:hypothetical protein
MKNDDKSIGVWFEGVQQTPLDDNQPMSAHHHSQSTCKGPQQPQEFTNTRNT